MLFASDNVVWVSWKYAAEEKIKDLRHTNEVDGSFVTAGARIHHYAYLELLQDRVLHRYGLCTLHSERQRGTFDRVWRYGAVHDIRITAGKIH